METVDAPALGPILSKLLTTLRPSPTQIVTLDAFLVQQVNLLLTRTPQQVDIARVSDLLQSAASSAKVIKSVRLLTRTSQGVAAASVCGVINAAASRGLPLTDIVASLDDKSVGREATEEDEDPDRDFDDEFTVVELPVAAQQEHALERLVLELTHGIGTEFSLLDVFKQLAHLKRLRILELLATSSDGVRAVVTASQLAKAFPAAGGRGRRAPPLPFHFEALTTLRVDGVEAKDLDRFLQAVSRTMPALAHLTLTVQMVEGWNIVNYKGNASAYYGDSCVHPSDKRGNHVAANVLPAMAPFPRLPNLTHLDLSLSVCAASMQSSTRDLVYGHIPLTGNLLDDLPRLRHLRVSCYTWDIDCSYYGCVDVAGLLASPQLASRLKTLSVLGGFDCRTTLRVPASPTFLQRYTALQELHIAGFTEVVPHGDMRVWSLAMPLPPHWHRGEFTAAKDEMTKSVHFDDDSENDDSDLDDCEYGDGFGGYLTSLFRNTETARPPRGRGGRSSGPRMHISREMYQPSFFPTDSEVVSGHYVSIVYPALPPTNRRRLTEDELFEVQMERCPVANDVMRGYRASDDLDPDED